MYLCNRYVHTIVCNKHTTSSAFPHFALRCQHQFPSTLYLIRYNSWYKPCITQFIHQQEHGRHFLQDFVTFQFISTLNIHKRNLTLAEALRLQRNHPLLILESFHSHSLTHKRRLNSHSLLFQQLHSDLRFQYLLHHESIGFKRILSSFAFPGLNFLKTCCSKAVCDSPVGKSFV